MKHITECIKKYFPKYIWNKDAAVELVLYLFCFFPFTVWVTVYFPKATALGTDTQPYAMIVSTLVVIFLLVTKKEKLAFPFCSLLVLGILAEAFGVMNLWDIGIRRVVASSATYISLFVIPYAFFYILQKQGGLNERIVKICIWVWMIVGLIQEFVNPNFGHMFSARQTTNVSRGVVSLASEPSAYGFVCFFLILFALDFKKKSKLYIGLLFIQIIALAGSSVTLIYIVVYIGCILLNNVLLRRWKAVGITVGGILVGLLGLYIAYHFQILPNRMQELTGYLLTGNWKLLFWDGSLKSRFYAIQTSGIEYMEFYGLPHGFQSYRVMSGIGILLIECGIIGILYMLTIGHVIWCAYPRKKSFIFTIGFMLVMLSAIPFSSPIVCAYIGYCIYKGTIINEQKAN